MIDIKDIVAVGDTTDAGRLVVLSGSRQVFVPNDLHNADFHTVNAWQEEQAQQKALASTAPEAEKSSE